MDWRLIHVTLLICRSISALRLKVKDAVDKAVERKRFGRNTTREQFLATQEEHALQKLSSMRAPSGILSSAINEYKSRHLFGDEYLYKTMSKKFGPASDAWNKTIDDHFATIWRSTIKEALLKEEEEARKQEETGSKPKNDTVAKKEEVELRTLTLSMKEILRPELTDMAPQIQQMIERRQVEITDDIQELAVLLRKAVHVVRILSGRLAHFK